MPRGLLLCLGLFAGLLTACGESPVPDTPIPTLPPIAPAPPATATPPGPPRLSTNQQIFATHTAEVAARQTVGAVPTLAPPSATAIIPPTRPPVVPTATVRPKAPTPRPPTPVVAQAKPPTARPKALTPAPADCLPPAQRAYVTQANAILTGITEQERVLWANIDMWYSESPPMANPVKRDAFNRAYNRLLPWVTQGQALHAPPEWKMAQYFWDDAMQQYINIQGGMLVKPGVYLNKADDDWVQWQDVLQPVIDAHCS